MLAVLVPVAGAGQYDLSSFEGYSQKTPTVAALGEYGEIPVSNYTGIPNISIPIYTLALDGKQFPIQLSYHGNGTRVEEQASWVGLGWSLNAMGMITQTVNGKRDDYENCKYIQEHKMWSPSSPSTPSFLYYITKSFNDIYGEQRSDSCKTGVNVTCGCATVPAYASCGIHTSSDVDVHPIYAIGSELNGYDLDPDMYTYSFFGLSGSYIRDRETGESIDFEGTGLKFESLAPSIYETDGYEYGWIARDRDGFIYEFKEIQLSTPPEFPTPLNEISSITYYLTAIEGPSGKRIEFEYKKGGANATGISVSQKKTAEVIFSEGSPVDDLIGGGTQFIEAKASCQITFQKYIDIIRMSDGSCLQFNTEDRLDMPRGNLYSGIENAIGSDHKLTEIKYYSTIEGEIPNSHPQWAIKFNTDYFSRTVGRTDLTTLLQNVTPLEKSLKLNSLKYLIYDFIYDEYFNENRFKLVDEYGYEFDYIEGELPHPNSSSRDYWGFYNGKQNGNTILPGSKRFLYPWNIYKNWNYSFESTPGYANREPDEHFAKVGMLRKIKYPTGGYSEFEWEANTYSNFENENSYSFEPISNGGTVRAGEANLSIPIEFHTEMNNLKVALTVEYEYDLPIPTGGVSVFLENLTTQTTEITSTVVTHPGGTVITRIIDPNQEYRLDIVNDNNITKVSATLSWEEKGELYSEKVGPGLRIGSITSYKSETEQVITTSYDYSGGKLMSPPRFNCIYDRPFTVYNGRSYQTTCHISEDVLFSSSKYGYSTGAQGSFIGYDQVIVNIQGKGTQTYQYHNEVPFAYPPTSIVGCPRFTPRINGSLISETMRNLQDEVVSQKEYNFVEQILNITNGVRMEVSPGAAPYFHNYYHIYPLVQSKVLLNSETTTMQGINGGETSMHTYYTYDNNTYNVNQIVTTNESNAVLQKQVLKYPDDYPGVVYDRMEELNYIGTPIEKKVYKGEYLLQGGSRIEYELVRNNEMAMPVRSYKILPNSSELLAAELEYCEGEKTLPVSLTNIYGNKVGYIYDDEKKKIVATLDNASENNSGEYLINDFENLETGYSTSESYSGRKSVYVTSQFNASSNTNIYLTGEFTLSAKVRVLSAGTPVVLVRDLYRKSDNVSMGKWSQITYSISNAHTWVSISRTCSIEELRNVSGGTSIPSSDPDSDYYIKFFVFNPGNYTYYLDYVTALPKNPIMSSFEYEQGVGVSKIVNFNGTTQEFEYDGKGRLLSTKLNGKLMQTHEYNFKFVPTE